MNIPIKTSPASPTIHKTLTKHEISDNALIHIQSQTDKLKEEIEKIPIARDLKMI